MPTPPKSIPKIKKSKHHHFPGQLEGEEMIFMVRRHWSIIFVHISRLMAGHIIAACIFAFLVYFLNWQLPYDGPLYVIMIMVISLYFLGIWLFYIYEFVDYHLDIWILTNQRILNIEQDGLFRRTVSELDILKIQDVTSELHGKVQTFLNYGNVHIQTAAAKQRFVFEQVGHPQDIARHVIKTVEQATRRSQQNPPANAALSRPHPSHVPQQPPPQTE